MSYNTNPYRKLTDDVDIGTMLSMRKEGLSNKQIAFRLGVSPTTIYKYIGRKSDAVKVAQMQGKPSSSVIPSQSFEKSPAVVSENKDERQNEENAQAVVEAVQETQPAEVQPNDIQQETKKSLLRVVSMRQTLQGSMCKYVIDTESDSIEIDGGGVLTGILDKKTLGEMIEELSEIMSMFTDR